MLVFGANLPLPEIFFLLILIFLALLVVILLQLGKLQKMTAEERKELEELEKLAQEEKADLEQIKAYESMHATDLKKFEKDIIELPRSNVLQFVLPNAVFSARPSGTEPKIKFYVSCWKDPGVDLDADKEEVRGQLEMIEEEIARISG